MRMFKQPFLKTQAGPRGVQPAERSGQLRGKHPVQRAEGIATRQREFDDDPGQPFRNLADKGSPRNSTEQASIRSPKYGGGCPECGQV